MTTPTDVRLLNIGPWSHGMDNLDDNVFVSDQTVMSCTNFLFNDFGIPVPRPGATKLYHGADVYGSSGAIFYMLGIYRDYTTTSKVFAAIQVINSTGNHIFFVPLNNALNAVTTRANYVTFANAYQYSKILTYNLKTYLIPVSDGVSVGQKTTDRVTYTAVSAIPRGDSAFILRDRMFVVNKTTGRIYYSKATDPETWASPDGGFFDVSPNDGEPIRTVVVNNDLMYIFKLTRTWVFGFSSDPGVDGSLRMINQDEGAISSVEYNGVLYLLTRKGVFQFSNGQYTDIGRPIINSLDINTGYNGTGIFALGRYLYVYLGSDLSTIWAMNLTTKAWSKLSYDSATLGNPFTTIYGKPVNLEGTPFVIASSGSTLWLMNLDGTAPYDTDTNNVVVSPHYALQSKRYTINSYMMFKHFSYMMLYTDLALDPLDMPPTLTVDLDAANTDHLQNILLTTTEPNFIRPVTEPGRFNAIKVAIDKPINSMVGATIDTAGRPVGAVQSKISFKQFSIFYSLQRGHLGT
jgi:hypothetical protein